MQTRATEPPVTETKNDRRRTAIVTGGGSGIGLAIAAMLVRNGYDVTIIGRRKQVLDSAAQQLSSAHPGASVIPLDGDLADPEFPARAVAEHFSRLGGLDCLVCAAGIYEQVHTLDMDVAVWDRVMNANVRGNLLAGFAAAKLMNAHGGGRIVFIGSVLMDQSEPRTLAYSASKAALASIVRSMAVDLAQTRVYVNGVAPGWVNSAMTESLPLAPEDMAKVNPQRRVADPSEIADVVRFLVLDAPRFLSGQMIVVDGGQTTLGATV